MFFVAKKNHSFLAQTLVNIFFSFSLSMQVSPGRFLPLLDEEIVNVFVGEKTSADVDS